MKIMSSADIRQRYNDVVSQCRDSGEPVYLTKNGQGELVVMDIDSFEKREQMIREFKELQKSNTKITKTINRISKELDKQIEESNYSDMVKRILNR